MTDQNQMRDFAIRFAQTQAIFEKKRLPALVAAEARYREGLKRQRKIKRLQADLAREKLLTKELVEQVNRLVEQVNRLHRICEQHHYAV